MNSTTRSVERTDMEVQEDDIQKFLRITEENNALLKEILAYVRKIQDKDYLNPEVVNIVKKNLRIK